MASLWFYGGLTATENVNLFSNIGLAPDTTNTASAHSPIAELETNPIGAMRHPLEALQDKEADPCVFDCTPLGRRRIP